MKGTDMSKTVGKVIRDKAEFLSYLDINFKDHLRQVKALKLKIDAMPDKGLRQKEKKEKALLALDELNRKFHARLGARVMGTYHFVVENGKYVPKDVLSKLA
jgi:hypothetical protein